MRGPNRVYRYLYTLLYFVTAMRRTDPEREHPLAANRP